MFKHVLVPTDFTEKDLRALDVAIGMACGRLCQVTLLHVIETIEDADEGEFSAFYEKLKVRAQQKMVQMAERYENEKLLIAREIAFGKRVKEIIRFAYDNEVDLIVLSSHRVDPNSGVQGWGTISYKVGILSHCPVMLIK